MFDGQCYNVQWSDPCYKMTNATNASMWRAGKNFKTGGHEILTLCAENFLGGLIHISSSSRLKGSKEF